MKPLPFILLFVFLFVTVTGCREEPVSEPAQPVALDDVIEAQAQREINEILLKANLDNPEEERKKARQETQRKVSDISQLTDQERKDEQYIRLSHELSYAERWNEAVEVAEKISQSAERNLLFGEIARSLSNRAWELYEQSLAGTKLTRRLPKAILEPIQQAVETTQKIDDPFSQAMMFQQIARIQAKMQDQAGAVTVLNDAVERCRQAPENIDKAKAFRVYIMWSYREGTADKTSALCQELETLLSHLEPSDEVKRIYQDVAETYSLLSNEEAAKRIQEKTGEK